MTKFAYMTDAEIIEKATSMYLEVTTEYGDGAAKVSITNDGKEHVETRENGYWVDAQVWVPASAALVGEVSEINGLTLAMVPNKEWKGHHKRYDVVIANGKRMGEVAFEKQPYSYARDIVDKHNEEVFLGEKDPIITALLS